VSIPVCSFFGLTLRLVPNSMNWLASAGLPA